ncbi:hypothetical protein K491DRAFT_675652 [Lophiostoma macrostomum CBS 122681]|uniref:Rhodopsin domain-containing protein n=1 Tax=Lophiostoma macrostomum CBS 122681 TaxID=1314788 RepID=A0A6A6TKE8_9PLEO|nr:hypothetical protein K491DRAFT_675652 [Lophiostoma macrostomum CBS 122681]
MASNDTALDKESQTALIHCLAIIFVTLSTASVVLRIYTRSRLLSVLGADDVTICIAQALAIAVSITTILEAVWGLGRHTQFVPAADAMKQSKSFYANTLVYNASQIMTKISFLIQYRRLFPGPKNQATCFWLLLFVAFWGITQEFLVSFACTPLTIFVPGMTGKCIDSLPVWYLTSSMNIITDFMIFIIPIMPVLKLQMRTRQKILLLCLFCLGFFTCIISLVRISTLHKGINTHDPFWDNAPAAYWSVVELNCGILCACFPTLRPLISKIIPHALSTARPSGKLGTSSNGTFNTLHTNDNQGSFGGIYVRHEVELHSTTELRDDEAGYRPSFESQRTTVTAQSKA